MSCTGRKGAPCTTRRCAGLTFDPNDAKRCAGETFRIYSVARSSLCSIYATNCKGDAIYPGDKIFLRFRDTFYYYLSAQGTKESKIDTNPCPKGILNKATERSCDCQLWEIVKRT